MINYLQNYEAIDKLVKNYFSLSEESQEKFSEKIMLGTTANKETIDKLDNNFRIERNLSIKQLENLDVSWKMFKYHFGEYCVDEEITYSEFLLNSKVNQKNNSRLTKDVKRYYSKNDSLFSELNSSYDLEDILIRINNIRLPRKKLKIVLSFNLSDMFMCSTGQDWTSCLNLESEYFGCYWHGLASLPFDTNRCMIYLAPQKQQDYNDVFGITSERMFRRAFGLLDENDVINILKWYPHDDKKGFYIPFLNEILSPFSLKKIDSSFVQKNKIEIPDMITDKTGNKISFYIYQDKSFLEGDRAIHFSTEKGNQHFINNFESEFGPYITCHGGLKRLILSNKEVVDFTGLRVICERCENRIPDEEAMFYNDRAYCNNCYEEIMNEDDEEEAW